MKKLLILSLVLLGGSAQAQTPAEVLSAYNAGVCGEFSLGDGCTDDQVLAAYCTTLAKPCVDSRNSDQRIYATTNAFATAVLLPPRQKAIMESRKNSVASRLMRVFMTNTAKCLAIVALVPEIGSPTVCK